MSAKVAVAFAKLAGVRRPLQALIDRPPPGGGGRPIGVFAPADAEHYFNATAAQLGVLRTELEQLYGDFPQINTAPETKMVDGVPNHFSRAQLERLARVIDQILEVRANSELAPPIEPAEPRVFISHGRTRDWLEVQAFIERDVGLRTLELAQEPNRGRTIIEKLEQESSRCSSAVIVMTGDDIDLDGVARARENVMHEIGYFQGKFGRSAVCLLHEEGANIPTNIGGLVYIPFPKAGVQATFAVLTRELQSFYRMR